MIIGAFGDLVFKVSNNQVYTFDDFKISTGYRSQQVDVIGNRPSTYKEGPELEKITFSIVLDLTLGIDDVGQEINRWRNMCNAGVEQPFNIGGIPLSDYMWLLKSVETDSKNIGPSGQIIKAILSVSMEEYVRAGTPPNQTENTTTGLDPNVSEKLFGSNPDLIRDNPQVNESLVNGLVGEAG